VRSACACWQCQRQRQRLVPRVLSRVHTSTDCIANNPANGTSNRNSDNGNTDKLPDKCANAHSYKDTHASADHAVAYRHSDVGAVAPPLQRNFRRFCCVCHPAGARHCDETHATTHCALCTTQHAVSQRSAHAHAHAHPRIRSPHLVDHLLAHFAPHPHPHTPTPSPPTPPHSRPPIAGKPSIWCSVTPVSASRG
jgi:hypothetical protein